jgi:hypothetical protein
MSTLPPDPYATLPQIGPYEVRIGRALISMVEPHPGHEAAYNRWMEDDHYYAGGLACPWLFAGKRWVATRDLQALRYPGDSRLVQPLRKGCYIGIFFVLEGRFEQFNTWVTETNLRLNRDGRVFMQRDHVFTSFQAYVGPVYRDAHGPRDYHALDHPYPGLVLEVVEAPDAASRPALERWLLEAHLPARLRGSPAAMCLAFRTEPRQHVPEYVTRTLEVTRDDRRVTLAWFLESDPRTCWAEWFAREGEAIAKGGMGRTDFCAPFIPTLHGSDVYVDELR